MDDTASQIAGRLESHFAREGFASPGVAALREAADVSLRTLYRHFPSRDDMVLGALEHRHHRYLSFVFDDLPNGAPAEKWDEVVARVCEWMQTQAPSGCAFQNALAAQPHSYDVRAMLARHKREVADRLSALTENEAATDALLLLHEGLTQTWVIEGSTAGETAQRLGRPYVKAA